MFGVLAMTELMAPGDGGGGDDDDDAGQLGWCGLDEAERMCGSGLGCLPGLDDCFPVWLCARVHLRLRYHC